MTSASNPVFPAEGLRFLRALKRNSRREWFQARRQEYERFVREPMVNLVLALRDDLKRIAPEIIADPALSLYRVYRDTRFSADKSPYKTHAAAVFPRRGLGKHTGASLYFHIATDEVLIAGGIYMPETPDLARLRQHIVVEYQALRAIVQDAKFRGTFGGLEGERLSRVPRGFPADHPAADLLQYKQFLAACARPPDFAATPRFYPTLLRCFERLMPLVRFLNEPLHERAASLKFQV